MSSMSQTSSEKEQDLQEAEMAYRSAWEDYSAYLAAHDINRRTLPEMEEARKLEFRCSVAKSQLDEARYLRYRL